MPGPGAAYQRLARWMTAGAILALIPAASLAAERVELRVGSASAITFTDFLRDGELLFLPFPQAITALGLTGFADPKSGSLFIRAREKLIVVSNTGLVAVEDRSFPLQLPPRQKQDAFYLPAEFFSGPLAKVLGQTISVKWVPEESRPETPLPMAARQTPVRLVVIDPGHGGSETGARGPGGLWEKDLTLKLARLLQAQLSRDPGLRVMLTREDDSQVDLLQRAEAANNLRADLFISIHANASEVVGAAGFETFFLSLEATDDEARKLAALENVTLNLKATPDSRLSDLELILGDMAQSEHLAESELFASLVQERLSRVMQTENRGVKQAPFRVLMQAAMPAVLVEVGFLSNFNEARSITRPETQTQMVQALAASVFAFRDLQSQRLGVPVQKPPTKTE